MGLGVFENRQTNSEAQNILGIGEDETGVLLEVRQELTSTLLEERFMGSEKEKVKHILEKLKNIIGVKKMKHSITLNRFLFHISMFINPKILNDYKRNLNELFYIISNDETVYNLFMKQSKILLNILNEEVGDNETLFNRSQFPDRKNMIFLEGLYYGILNIKEALEYVFYIKSTDKAYCEYYEQHKDNKLITNIINEIDSFLEENEVSLDKDSNEYYELILHFYMLRIPNKSTSSKYKHIILKNLQKKIGISGINQNFSGQNVGSKFQKNLYKTGSKIGNKQRRDTNITNFLNDLKILGRKQQYYKKLSQNLKQNDCDGLLIEEFLDIFFDSLFESNVDLDFVGVLYMAFKEKKISNDDNIRISSIYKKYKQGKIENTYDLQNFLGFLLLASKNPELQSFSEENRDYLFSEYSAEFIEENVNFFLKFKDNVCLITQILGADFVQKNIENIQGFKNISSLLKKVDIDLIGNKNLYYLLYVIFWEEQNQVSKYVEEFREYKQNLIRLKSQEDLFLQETQNPIDIGFWEFLQTDLDYENLLNLEFAIQELVELNNKIKNFLSDKQFSNEITHRRKIYDISVERLIYYVYFCENFDCSEISERTLQNIFLLQEDKYHTVVNNILSLANNTALKKLNHLSKNEILYIFYHNFADIYHLLDNDFENIQDILSGLNKTSFVEKYQKEIEEILDSTNIDVTLIFEYFENLEEEIDWLERLLKLFKFLKKNNLLPIIESSFPGGIEGFVQQVLDNVNSPEQLSYLNSNNYDLIFISNYLDIEFLLQTVYSSANLLILLNRFQSSQLDQLIEKFSAEQIDQTSVHKNIKEFSEILIDFLLGKTKIQEIEKYKTPSSKENQTKRPKTNILSYWSPQMGSREVEALLKRFGFLKDRQGSTSHRIFRHPGGKGAIVVPMGKDSLPVGTLRNILKTAALILEEG
ncbi:type II toxin-antitoxin system HicA family toxin [Candidatus Absconditicoccus praedator]|uniref:type II toxin-antitoxin system HicA family toxin n=1 Tax=Candidatus Absconditicoccus praedator TaxID=2735562 RepID=UPI001E3D71BA|nr:type II toxin-antitoxin system HicA family toxin [Candidatus Absconditicoccus praedator]UFX83462.1 type II toxin-antitoxin system HicA family toxin [Candidatus Absconditicoccus praedator]